MRALLSALCLATAHAFFAPTLSSHSLHRYQVFLFDLLDLNLLVMLSSSFNIRVSNSFQRMRMQLKPSSPGEVEASVRSAVDSMKSTVKGVASGTASIAAATIISSLVSPPAASAKDPKIWEKVDLPVKDTLFDITFDPKKPEHGWLVGAKGNFFETFDGGKSWNTRTFTNLDEDEEITYRFEVADLSDNEGWVVGKPSILLHTKDGGKQFERIPLPPKLPGTYEDPRWTEFSLFFLILNLTVPYHFSSHISYNLGMFKSASPTTRSF